MFYYRADLVDFLYCHDFSGGVAPFEESASLELSENCAKHGFQFGVDLLLLTDTIPQIIQVRVHPSYVHLMQLVT